MAARKDEIAQALQDQTRASAPVLVADAQGSIWVPHNRLKDSPDNVRTVAHTREHIATLASLIDRYGLMHPLSVTAEATPSGEPTGFYLVNAGKGRRLAQALRIKQGKIAPDEPIWCRLGKAADARGESLAENCHAPMHPADEFVAFRDLIAAGNPIEDVAALWGVKPEVVERRMKLANVAPEFVDAYRKGSVSLEQLMAFAVTDDHEHQRKVWESLHENFRGARELRRALTEHEVSTQSPQARFVADAYRKAGGPIRKDLFSKEGEGFICDTELLNRLVTEKLKKAEARARKEGFAWIDSRPQLLQADLSAFSRVEAVLREPTEDEARTLKALGDESDTLENERDGLGEDAQERADEIDDRLYEIEEAVGAINEARREVPVEKRVLCGVIVSIDESGKLLIVRGLVRPEDRRKFNSAKTEVPKAGSENPRTDEPEHSAVLTRSLTAHRTLALRAALASRTDVALVALAHCLVEKSFSPYGDRTSPVEIASTRTPLDGEGEDIRAAKGTSALAQLKEQWAEKLKVNEGSLFQWLLGQPQSEVLDLLAFCVAETLYGVQSSEGDSKLDEIARAVSLNMREWWAPTAKHYFARIPKARMIAAVTEAASPEAAGALNLLKKHDAAELAEQRVASTPWLPALMRTPEGK